MRQKISERELDVLQALWQIGEAATIAEVHRRLRETGIELAYTTVQTMLCRLETKGAVARDDSARPQRFRPLAKEPTTVGGAIENLVRRFFGGSVEALATRLVEEELSPEQIGRIQTLIAAQRRKGDGK
ncbi:MAG TPA: BlaI/MecI/CopY family transcriptional regulator [Pyrinomonadaceae bacterium]|jgi:predicted transcriptional regulator